jgi:hypothetical protein
MSSTGSNKPERLEFETKSEEQQRHDEESGRKTVLVLAAHVRSQGLSGVDFIALIDELDLHAALDEQLSLHGRELAADRRGDLELRWRAE